MINFFQMCTRHEWTTKWTNQQFKEPEAWFIVAGLEGVDEEKHHEAIENQGVDLHGDGGLLRVQAGQDAEAPQNSQKARDLQDGERETAGVNEI